MGFSSKKVGGVELAPSRKEKLTSATAIKYYTRLCLAMMVLIVGRRTVQALAEPTRQAVSGITKVVSQTVGEPLIMDDYGKVNVLIVGYAGDQYRGGKLTDTMMVASYDPSLGAVSFVSIPRDTYVNYDNGSVGRINGLYRSHTLQASDGNEHASGSLALMNKVSDITGLDVSYSVFVDFDGFVSFIDEIGGINVDVPESLYDDQYPGPDDSYTVFEVSAGVQQFDGETALKYARSRKSTSDFSRALRQQQIIAATIQQVTNQFSLSNVGNIRSLYNSAMKVLQTDIPLDQLLRLGQYAEGERHFFSFVYTAECNSYNINLAQPACTMYYADRSQFGGQAVMLPQGATAGALSVYEATAAFGSWVSRHQEMLIENPQITILNAIDTQRARSEGINTNGIASQFGIELIEYGYTIESVNNAPVDQDNTVIVLAKTGVNTNTIWSLRSFIEDDFDIVVDPLIASGRAGENIMQIILGYEHIQ